MRLGAPVFIQTEDPAELARAHRAEGYRAAYCPAWLSLDAPDRIREAEAAFAAEDVVIAEVGAWGNMIGPDAAKREAHLAKVRDRLSLADEVGARCCVDYAGTFDPDFDYGPHPQNFAPEGFDFIVETIRGVIDAVRPKRAKFGLEMMPWSFPESADDYVRLLAAVDRPAFAVHLDPVNIITSPRRYFANGDLIRECFAKLGPHIASCHAKDVVLRPNYMADIGECPPGTGGLDYRAFLTGLSALPQEPPLMLEHLPGEAEYRQARDYVLSVATEAGLSFV